MAYATISGEVTRSYACSVLEARAGIEQLYYEMQEQTPPGVSIEWNTGDNGFEVTAADADEGEALINIFYSADRNPGRARINARIDLDLTRRQLENNGGRAGARAEVNGALENIMSDVKAAIESVVRRGVDASDRGGLGD